MAALRGLSRLVSISGGSRIQQLRNPNTPTPSLPFQLVSRRGVVSKLFVGVLAWQVSTGWVSPVNANRQRPECVSFDLNPEPWFLPIPWSWLFSNIQFNMEKLKIDIQLSILEKERSQDVPKTDSDATLLNGISFYTTEDALSEAFSQFGQVVEAKIVIDRVSDRSKGFGFVTFASEDEAQKAITEMNGKVLNGRTIFVDKAKTKQRLDDDGPLPIARGPPGPLDDK